MRSGALAIAVLLSGCMRAPVPPSQGGGAPAADSVTLALWHMDEPAGSGVQDSGPNRLRGTAGPAVARPFGRFGGGLEFGPSVDSFVYVPYQTALESPSALTIEAWICPTEFGDYEDTPIVSRWTDEANKQSWIFSVAGRRFAPVGQGGPGSHRTVFPDAMAGKLLFAYQPETAGPPQAYVSTRVVERKRWTHVAVSFDGQVVRFYIDGELDSQFASPGRIRTSEAPVLIGNSFDVRFLTGFGGELRPNLSDPTPYYAFQGRLDEMRLSSAARADFPTLAPR